MDRLPGFRDFYPEPLPTQDVWSFPIRRRLAQTWRDSSERFGFYEYDGPPLETLELYTAKSGDEIVGQLYHFDDKGGRSVALRPEMTPTLVRMAALHARNYKKPIKWFSIPQLFRYERQQKGRLREHFQWNADIIGESDLAADAELIALMVHGLTALGLTQDDFIIRLSSRNAWQAFFEERCSDAGKAYDFFQTIDKLERERPEVSDQKLKDLGFAPEEVRRFIESGEPTDELTTLLNHLRQRGIAEYVRIDYHVIRGLAYYTGPVFEAFDQKGEFRAIAGGGRYDHLFEHLTRGKVKLPALGFGMGDVVLAELLQARGKTPGFQPSLDYYVVIDDEDFRPEATHLANELRRRGNRVDYSLVPQSPNKQFKRARELGAQHTVKLVPAGTNVAPTLIVKKSTGGEETACTQEELLQHAVRE